ncbi:hypothetical protein BUALT_Bualt13G0122200 [Buddleja alternifolia]|uniref:hAT-like transposase RNase-H fold domain-containing protein n=1 Tax=Buddleja alternifolia TaxID=168488 RepID=A0AAV6WVB0_9LAMI|nr:hypothetical protein BUALT_Bualt13G0122200 [Buddleja alternifolia]
MLLIAADFDISEMDKLQWGNRKRLRCVKVKDSSLNGKSDGSGGGGGVVKKKITSRVVDNINSHNNHTNNSSKEGHVLTTAPSPHRPNRELGMNRSITNDSRKASTSLSPEKEDRYYTTRGSGGFDDGTKVLFANPKEENRKIVWPKLLITLSSKEKEEDFMAMKGCKPPQRPKKRAKLIQRTILLVSPGAWLTDLCQERYEVREKKTSKKKDVPSQEANDVEIIMEMAAPVDEQEEAQNVESGNVPQQNNLNGTNATKRSPLEVHKEPYRPPPKKIQRAKAVEVVKTEGPKNVSEIWGHFTRLKAFERLGEEDHKFIDYFDDYEMNQEGECGGRRGKGKGSKIIGPPMDVDWTNARNFVKFLKIFYNVTLKFSGSSYITSNSFFRELATVHVGLSNMISKGDYQMASMALRMKEKFNKYWGNIDNINWLLFIAILLDPRYKLKYVNFGFATIYEGDGSFVKRMTGKVEDMLCLLYKHYAEPNFQQTGRDEHPKPGYNYMNVDDEDDPSELLESQFAKHLEDEECVESKSENLKDQAPLYHQMINSNEGGFSWFATP